MNYYKAWLNLARCHGSDSYVILPGRDHADSSYYRDNIRNHTTASVAFLYSFSTPKLRVHGAAGRPNDTGQAGRLSPSPSAGLRTFHNADRSRSIEAGFVSFNPASGVVRVRLNHGGIRDIPLLSLCEEDQKYVKQQATGGE